MKPEQAQSHEDNPYDCSNSPQKLRCDGLRPSVASATNLERPDKSQSTLNNLLLNQYSCPNSSDHRIYLCDYTYQGHKWSVEIPATSFQDAQRRLNALKNGEIVGELKTSIPIPAKPSWLTRLARWIGR